MHNKIDHVAVGARSLDEGVAALRQQLGVTLPRGGKHAAMSTHNCVARAGEGCFLEVIAVDPKAPAPERSRWFTLDDPTTQARLAARPRPLCWVVGTDDLDGVIAASPVDLGEVLDFSRGERSWRLTVPRDGSLPEGGLLPAFIEWSPGPHPSVGMQDLGLALEAVVLSHPDPERLQGLLRALKVAPLARVEAGAPALAFAVRTPAGRVTLG
ncbi:MAG: VOC family protein [Rhodospirillales bacterium]